MQISSLYFLVLLGMTFMNTGQPFFRELNPPMRMLGVVYDQSLTLETYTPGVNKLRMFCPSFSRISCHRAAAVSQNRQRCAQCKNGEQCAVMCYYCHLNFIHSFKIQNQINYYQNYITSNCSQGNLQKQTKNILRLRF